MDYIRDLHEMCETISNEIAEANDKIRSAGGKLSGSDLDYVDKLTHALKSIKTTIAMMESEGSYDGSYNDGMSGTYGSRMYYPRGSYARRRNSMGRYSRDDDTIAELRELMADAKDERTRQEFQKFISKMEQM